jgi:hypothetical protein
MPLDLTITPIYRLTGQEAPALPGLLALLPPPNAVRGRERDHLIVYLLLAGTASFSTGEYMQVAQDAADMFYQTSGALTTALRAAAELVNATLLQRNMTTSSQGQYAVGWLTFAVLRDSQCTFAMSGPMHIFYYSQNEMRHIYEPATSGKGLGASQTASIYYAQATLSAYDRLLFLGRAPNEWTPVLQDATPASLGAMRRRLVTSTQADLNAALMQATEGKGVLNLLSGTEEIKEIKREAPKPQIPSAPVAAPTPPAHVVQPAGYSQPRVESRAPENPPQDKDPLASLPRASTPRDFPPSIPRIGKPVTEEPPAQDEESQEEIKQEEEAAPAPRERKVREPRRPRRREPSERTRQTARTAAAFIQWSRRVGDSFGAWFGNFLPKLLPSSEVDKPYAASGFTMLVIAVIVPVVIAVMGFTVFDKLGRSQQYYIYLSKAQELRAQALAVGDPVAQRKSWEAVLLNVDQAEANAPSRRPTSETIALRQEANNSLDQLLGILRLQFNPAFSVNLGFDVSRMAASDFDLYLLNAETGEVLRAQSTNNGRGFQIDPGFNCGPGKYGDFEVGHLVDILAMPGLNVNNATLLGIDAAGNLLYCAPGQVALAIQLPPPDTNWKRVTAFVMDSGNLYVLDAEARAVWVYTGKDGTFIDRPYFFFGNQTPEKQDAIDLIVSGDELFMLHGDGHLSTCSYSRIESKPTRCQDPTPLLNPFPAYQDLDLFGSAKFTQVLFTMPPDASLLLLDADTQAILRFSPRSFELQNQLRPQTGSNYSVPRGTVGAIAFAPNHVLYMTVNRQVYFSTNVP